MIDTRTRDKQQPLFHLEMTEQSASVTTAEAARLLGCHQRTVQKKLRNGTLAYAPDGGVDIESLTRYQEAQQTTDTYPLRAVRRQDPGKTLTVAQTCIAQLQEQVIWLKAELKASQQREADILTVLKSLTGQGSHMPAVSTARRPPQRGTLRYRILEFLQQEGKARNVAQIMTSLSLTSSPARTLRALKSQGLLVSPKPGLFCLVDTALTDKAVEALPPDSLLRRIYEEVRQAGRPLWTAEIRTRLELSRNPRQELSKLCAEAYGERRLVRLRPGLFGLPDTPEVTPKGQS